MRSGDEIDVLGRPDEAVHGNGQTADEDELDSVL